MGVRRIPTVLSRETDWIDSISRTLNWNVRGAKQKGWSKGEFGIDDGQCDESAKEPEFDIDFGDDERGLDSGYEGGEGSSVGLEGSPRRRMKLF